MAIGKMKTRGKSSTKAAADAIAATASTAPKVPLQAESTNPPKLFVLPKGISSSARIVTIANPADSTESRYLCCPEKGFYEFRAISVPRATPGSWLLVPSEPSTTQLENVTSNKSVQDSDGDYTGSQGYVTKTAELFLATPIDPLFIILPYLAPPTHTPGSEPAKRLFLSIDDYFDALTLKSPHLSSFLRESALQKLVEARIATVCDTVDAGDEAMYRLNESKLLQELLQKAKRMAEGGLPASMEEKFVRRALEAPMLGIKLGGMLNDETVGDEDTSSTTTPASDGVDSQVTISSTDPLTSSKSVASTAATSFSDAGKVPSSAKPSPPAPIIAPDGIPELLRLRTALTFITTSYLPPNLRETLSRLLSATPPSSDVLSSIDFAPLNAHLTHLSKLRQEALACRSLGDYSQKRSLCEDDEASETRADKKRKKEEEEKRKKAGESRGVRDLKKVNVTGMRKMSEFFKKKG